MHISIAKFTKVIFINFIILFLFILCVEILCTLFFDSPVRFIYPFSKTTRDSQTDFDVIYNVDWKTGNRIIDCNNRNNSKNRKVIFVGDSFVFGQGLHVEDTFVYLYACKTGDQVRNLGAIGIGLQEYREIIINQDLANVKLVYLVFYDNDLAIDERKDLISRIKSFVKYKSFNYLILRKLKNYIYYGIIDSKNKITYKGTINNPASVFNKDPYHLEKWFEINEYKSNKIEEEILRISEYVRKNPGTKLIIMVIPESSVVSMKNVNYYKSVGSLYLPKFLEISELAKTIRLLSKKYSFEYLPLYEHIIEVYTKKNAEYYFDTDFHLNRKGSEEVFNYIMSNKY